MCSHFIIMENTNFQGDLTDIVRGNVHIDNISDVQDAGLSVSVGWQFPGSNPISGGGCADEFGDPFSSSRDPLLHDIDTPIPTFFGDHQAGNSTNSVDMCRSSGSSVIFSTNEILDDEMIKRTTSTASSNTNIFSKMLQISPNIKLPLSPCDSPVAVASPRALPPPPPPGRTSLMANNDHLILPNSSKTCLVETGPVGVQISSPRNTGIKRRKSQAKKVVCIPAPAPANSRPSGEVVPSDLWAWRKYGQKPIKGSPYPRGYYRCSSSKGCSARKQVERSRTDPNMLVITYTSEHNHPWPTQRNALAGSTRSQPPKTSQNSVSKTPINSQLAPKSTTTSLKEEQKETTTETTITPPSNVDGQPVKDEKEDLEEVRERNRLENVDDVVEFDQGFPHSYKPTLPDFSKNHGEDFFADLEEIEADPLDLLFSQGFPAGGRENNKAVDPLDPFSFYDWTPSGNNSNTSSNNNTTNTKTS